MTIQSQLAHDHVYAVILAGGSGTRFWPKSRLRRPKQLCRIGDDHLTMIERTLARLDGLIPISRRMIITHVDQLEATKKIAGSRCRHFIGEPEARNTAAALAVAALEIEKLAANSSGAIMVSLHADHLIDDEEQFRSDIGHAIAVASTGYLTLVGIPPTKPATGFGYIECGAKLDMSSGLPAFKVASFREKPSLDVAKEYLSRGGFFWNSGYFIWRTSTIIAELEEHLPITIDSLRRFLYESASTFADADSTKLAAVYAKLPKIAIDNAILEVSQRVAFIPARFGWNDIGSWDALDECFDHDVNGNIVNGDAMLVDCRNSIVESDGLFIGVIGVEDLVVVQSGNAILVTTKKRSQDVKSIVEALQKQGRKNLTD
jgi:mannose-1-phosphate guanylyltransferase/mannose-6-phosphate isomerase